MIEYVSGDIIQCQAQALVNTVNCVGVMGRGIALQFKNAYPDNFKAYEKACKEKSVQTGRMFVFETETLTNPQFIINFPTKQHWRDPSRMEYIENGLVDLISVIRKYNIQSIAIPPLGAGLGGLDWQKVRSLIVNALQDLNNVQIMVFEPQGSPSNEKMVHSLTTPNMTKGRAILINFIDKYCRAGLDPFITLLEIHKLMYFMQETGEVLRLRYTKALYGPYAENLRQVMNVIEGHFITGYADGGDNPYKEIELKANAVEQAQVCLSHHQDSQERFERVIKLIDGFETPDALELLATVHWVMKKEQACTEDEVQKAVYAWNERKQKFSHRKIELARKRLIEQGWCSA